MGCATGSVPVDDEFVERSARAALGDHRPYPSVSSAWGTSFGRQRLDHPLGAEEGAHIQPASRPES